MSTRLRLSSILTAPLASREKSTYASTCEARAVPGCELELYGTASRQNRHLDRAGLVELALDNGLPPDAWLWLKRGTRWLDYRALDPHSARAVRGEPQHTGVEIDVPIDPQTRIEALLATGEGRMVLTPLPGPIFVDSSFAVMPLGPPRPGGWSGFLPGRLFGPSGSKSGGDEDAAEVGEHVGGGGVG